MGPTNGIYTVGEDASDDARRDDNSVRSHCRFYISLASSTGTDLETNHGLLENDCLTEEFHSEGCFQEI